MIPIDNSTQKGRSGKFRVTLKKKLKHNTAVTKPIIRIFVSKKTPSLLEPSVKLKALLQKYSMESSIDIKKNDSALSVQQKRFMSNERTSSTTLLNGFTAFRAYYSKNTRSYKEQIELSRQLAKIWKVDTELHDLWSRYVNEYKVSSTSDSFVEWMKLAKSSDEGFSLNMEKSDHFRTNPFLFLVVEDVYDTVNT